ncbi:Stp1/IreP family PP2C-type Ser/Thr phosphatase [Alkalicoccus daliensis]|uniref:protein-serine/threonine phosphatase n=1 Tax=Alkalicoccus daliensis TaxID=745820 RepID=A0A1H0A0S9_9BACI|nr:Stp1/IreP family PP2C-type Ser/Thr phosphatase [Alkalicoccus daliensis]SDN26316.1 Serine/threonine protein phosphatase PrpC [Alkalicoccus daliensis]
MERSYGTDQGQVRKHNEDSVTVSKRNSGEFMAVVADGMGGHQAGDVASRLACETLITYFQEFEEIFEVGNTTKWLKTTVEKTNEILFEYQQTHPECRGMGTTLTAAVCTNEFFAYVNVGDSRLYYQQGKSMRQVTSDHSLVGELVRQGELTEEEAEVHPRKNVLLRALGTDELIESDTGLICWDEDDAVFLCSDGLSNKLSDNEIREMFLSEKNIDALPGKFIEIANKRGGEDNITVAIVRNSPRDVNHT